MALGYEDLNDHEELRHDPLLGVLVGKRAAGEEPLAGKSTLKRLELARARADRYKRIAVGPHGGGALLRRGVLGSGRPEPASRARPRRHRRSSPRSARGSLLPRLLRPLLLLAALHLLRRGLLWAQLRRSDIDASAGAVEAVAQVVGQIRERWPQVSIVLRGDSGFAREALMAWCEEHAVDYVFGLARNRRLQRAVGAELQQAASRHGQSGEPERVFKDFSYQTRKSWSRARRVVARPRCWARGRIRASSSPRCPPSSGRP